MKEEKTSLIPILVLSLLAVCAVLLIFFFTDAGNPSSREGSEISGYEACVAAGYTVEPIADGNGTKICRTPEGRTFINEEREEELCSRAGGHWNECSNRCLLAHQGEEGAVCTAVCEALCECGGIAGFPCPAGQVCIQPEGIPDALGYCAPSNTGVLNASEAYALASSSECVGKGRLAGAILYNANSRTWWIDLELHEANPLCHPACVVHGDTGEVEINWRCTGLIPPEETS